MKVNYPSLCSLPQGEGNRVIHAQAGIQVLVMDEKSALVV